MRTIGCSLRLLTRPSSGKVNPQLAHSLRNTRFSPGFSNAAIAKVSQRSFSIAHSVFRRPTSDFCILHFGTDKKMLFKPRLKKKTALVNCVARGFRGETSRAYSLLMQHSQRQNFNPFSIIFVSLS